MSNELTVEDIDVILESLRYSKSAIEDYPHHPTYEFKQNQLERVEKVLTKMRVLRDTVRK